jgi:hypothetical protein
MRVIRFRASLWHDGSAGFIDNYFVRGHNSLAFPMRVGEVLPDCRTGVSPDLQNKRLILKADLLLDRWSRAGFHET